MIPAPGVPLPRETNHFFVCLWHLNLSNNLKVCGESSKKSSTHPYNRHGGLVLERRPVEIQVDGEQLGVLHQLLALAVERGESVHEPPELEDNVLDVLVVQELQFDEDVGAEFGEAGAGVGAAPEDESSERTRYVQLRLFSVFW